MKENDHQYQIKLSVMRQGGYSTKLSNQFTIGIPDLLIALPPFVPCLAEVKDLGKVVENFNQQIGITPKQALELKRIEGPYAVSWRPVRVAFILVTLEWKGDRILVGLPKEAERLTGAMIAGGQPCRKRQRGIEGSPPWYDMIGLMSDMEVTKI